MILQPTKTIAPRQSSKSRPLRPTSQCSDHVANDSLDDELYRNEQAMVSVLPRAISKWNLVNGNDRENSRNIVKHRFSEKVYGLLGTIVLLTLQPKLVYGGCVFGADNLDQLVLRNNTIVGLMNDTLLNYTDYSHKAIAEVSNFMLWNYLQKTYSLTNKNYLDFVTMGKLLVVDWTSATAGVKTNESSVSRTVASFISTEFVDPLHNKLQATAVYYSITLGIFRPKQMQFNFTGITLASSTTSTNTATLDLSCSAGSYFLWRVSTGVSYNKAFDNARSVQFVTAAHMVEDAFDRYYRTHIALNKDFVRVNVVAAQESLLFLVLHMEAYFLNSSYSTFYMSSSTTISKLPPTYYDDPTTTSAGAKVDIRDSTYTHILSSAYPPPTTKSISTTTQTTTLASSPASTATSFGPSTATSSSASTASPDQVQASTSPSILNSSMATRTINAYTANLTTLGLFTNSSELPSISTQNWQGTSSTTLNASMLPISVASSYNRSNSEQTTLPFQAAATNVSTVSPNVTQSSQDIYLNSLNASLASVTGSSNLTFSTLQNASGIITNLTNFNQTNQSTTVNGSVFPYNFSNLATPETQTGNTVSKGNQNATTAGGIDGVTTFDPDPFFQAQVPKVTKIYNGTMRPISEQAAFFSVTLPVAIGIIAAVIICMLCWQVDCLFKRRKV